MSFQRSRWHDTILDFCRFLINGIEFRMFIFVRLIIVFFEMKCILLMKNNFSLFSSFYTLTCICSIKYQSWFSFSIYEKLIEFCGIDEKGTNYPPVSTCSTIISFSFHMCEHCWTMFFLMKFSSINTTNLKYFFVKWFTFKMIQKWDNWIVCLLSDFTKYYTIL